MSTAMWGSGRQKCKTSMNTDIHWVPVGLDWLGWSLALFRNGMSVYVVKAAWERFHPCRVHVSNPYECGLTMRSNLIALPFC
jgi:hypothetical protein